MTNNRVLEMISELAEWAESYDRPDELVGATPNLQKLEALSIEYPVAPENPEYPDEAPETAYYEYFDKLTCCLDMPALEDPRPSTQSEFYSKWVGLVKS